MKIPVVLTKETLKEEADAFFFHEQQSEGLGEKFLVEVERVVNEISAHPTYYSFIDDTHTIRDVALNKFPFILIFEELPDQIIIYHIHHTSKQRK